MSAPLERGLLLFDDARAREWAPFAATRPVGELLFGDRRLRERVERWAGLPCVGHLCGPQLRGWDEPGAAPVVDGARPEMTGRAGVLIWLSRAVPTTPPPEFGATPLTLVDESGVVGWWRPVSGHGEAGGGARGAGGAGGAGEGMEPGESPWPNAEALEQPDTFSPGSVVRVQTLRLGWPWHLVAHNADQLCDDLGMRGHTDAFRLEPGTWTVGDHPILLGPGAHVGPGVVLDVRDGPIRLDADVSVDGPARLTGPLYLGPGTRVFGGHIARVSAGPTCKLRGEIADSVLLGFDNKAHDGYLGHALLGRWVNLGSGTTNSDLKNTYGSVRVDLGQGPLDSGLQKVGVLLGDHVKTGIGTLLTTGGVVGAASSVFGGGGPAPRHVAPFSWGGAPGSPRYEWPAFVATARQVMARRGQVLSPGVEAVLERLWHGVAEAG